MGSRAMKEKGGVIFGAFQFSDHSPKIQRELLDICEESGIREIDSGIAYENCEPALKEVGATTRFTINGKSMPSMANRQAILENCQKSLDDLGISQFDGYYLHAPDPKTPIEETVDAVQELYKNKKFRRFGLSNYLASDVERIHAYASSKGHVLPTIYQGNYSAVSRRTEADLFPTLRRLGIAFHAYSPHGGGYFTKTPQIIKEGKEGRFNTKNGKDIVGLVYQAMYIKPSYLAALDSWAELSARSNVPKAELAYRWMTFHSALEPERGDMIMVGASQSVQLRQSMEARKKGPLERSVVTEIDRIWESVRHEASLDCVNGWYEDIKLGRVTPPEGLGY